MSLSVRQISRLTRIHSLLHNYALSSRWRRPHTNRCRWQSSSRLSFSLLPRRTHDADHAQHVHQLVVEYITARLRPSWSTFSSYSKLRRSSARCCVHVASVCGARSTTSRGVHLSRVGGRSAPGSVVKTAFSMQNDFCLHVVLKATNTSELIVLKSFMRQ